MPWGVVRSYFYKERIMLTEKQKLMFGEVVLTRSIVMFQVTENYDRNVINSAVIELSNNKGQSFCLEIVEHKAMRDGDHFFVGCQLANSVKALELSYPNCTFDLDPMTIDIDLSIVGELIFKNAITVKDAMLFLVLPNEQKLMLELQSFTPNNGQ